jgi:hypothetical protein
MHSNSRLQTKMSYDLDENLLTRAALIQAGATFHQANTGTEYALLPPDGNRHGHHLLRLDGDTAKVVGATAHGVDPSRLLNETLDGTGQARADRFFAQLDERTAAVNPAVSEPLRAAGYDVAHTGGGCLAWMRLLDEEGDSYLLITSNEDIDGDPAAPEWVVGRYDGDSWINLEESFTLPDAIRVAGLLPRAVGELVQEVYPDLAAALAANAREAAADIDYRRLVVIEHLALFDNIVEMMKPMAGREVNLSPTVWAALCVALAQSVQAHRALEAAGSTDARDRLQLAEALLREITGAEHVNDVLPPDFKNVN